MRKKRGQVGLEYLVVISFVVFLVIGALGVAISYSSQIQDSIKFNQLEKAARKIIFTAESIFYDGEPAKAEINIYFPEGIEQFQILPNELVFDVSTGTGTNRISYSSTVPLSGSISSPRGVKNIRLHADENGVVIEEG